MNDDIKKLSYVERGGVGYEPYDPSAVHKFEPTVVEGTTTITGFTYGKQEDDTGQSYTFAPFTTGRNGVVNGPTEAVGRFLKDDNTWAYPLTSIEGTAPIVVEEESGEVDISLSYANPLKLDTDNKLTVGVDNKTIVVDANGNLTKVNNWRGVYDIGSTYKKDDIVTYTEGDETAAYIAKQDIDVAEAWTPDHWQVLGGNVPVRDVKVDGTSVVTNKIASIDLTGKADVSRVQIIEGKIPTEATTTNQLADKDYVNQQVAASSGKFRGTHDELDDIFNLTELQKNDYALWDWRSGSDSQYRRYKVVDNALDGLHFFLKTNPLPSTIPEEGRTFTIGCQVGGSNYSGIKITSNSLAYWWEDEDEVYHEDVVYLDGVWTDEINRPITFVTAPTGDLAAWLAECADETRWAFEYALNNTSFTTTQWAAINSGINETKRVGYDTYVSKKFIYSAAMPTGLLAQAEGDFWYQPLEPTGLEVRHMPKTDYIGEENSAVLSLTGLRVAVTSSSGGDPEIVSWGDSRLTCENEGDPVTESFTTTVTFTDEGVDLSTNIPITYYATFDEAPITFTAVTTNSAVRLDAVTGLGWTGYYKINGQAWETYTAGTTITLAEAGDMVSFKGTLSDYSSTVHPHITSVGNITVKGNVMSLYAGDEYATATTLTDYACYSLFENNTAISNIQYLKLPATTIGVQTYDSMFKGCTAITHTPDVEAVTIGTNGLANMFSGCTALANVTVKFTSWGYTAGWLTDVAAVGTFNAPSELAWPSSRGVDTVPSGWTIVGPYPVLQSITVKNAPTITRYTELYTLVDMTGLVVTATYPDGITEDIEYGAAGLSYSPAEGQPVSASGDITITYTDAHSYAKSTTQAITYELSGYAGLVLTPSYANSVSTIQLERRMGTAIPDHYYTGSYSYNGVDWYTNPFTSIEVKAGRKICFKGNQLNDFYTSRYIHFTTTDSFIASGNCNSVWFGDNYASVTSIPDDHGYMGYRLFSGYDTDDCTIDIGDNFSLPISTIYPYGYCCYQEMFRGNTSVTSASFTLPAMMLCNYCYYGMFQGCTNLTTVNTNMLPATTMEYVGQGDRTCYGYMFAGCSNLATNGTCFNLPATTLSDYCYTHMFDGCSKFADIAVKFTEWGNEGATDGWLIGVAENGTFDCPLDLDVTETGTSKVPANWTVVKPTPSSLTITTAPTRTVYTDIIDKLTYAGLVATITYSDGTTKTVNYGDSRLSYSPADGSTVTGATTLNISFTDRATVTNSDVEVTYTASGFTGLVLESVSGESKVGLAITGSTSKYVGAYSMDGLNWTTLTEDNWDTHKKTLTEGQKICFKGTQKINFNPPEGGWAEPPYSYINIHMESGSHVKASGNIISLYDQNNYKTATSLTYTYGAWRLFADNEASYPYSYAASLVDASGINFGNVTTLPANWGYKMFNGCINITTAPNLTATTLGTGCYYQMFYGCTNLNSLTVSFTTWPSTSNWLYGVAATGTFTAPDTLPYPAARGATTVPAGWEIVGPYLKPDSIAVKTEPKKEYWTGDTLDLSDLVTTVTYNNGTTQDKAYGVEGLVCEPDSGTILTTAGTTSVSITYTEEGYPGVTCGQDITVAVPYMTGIDINTAPTKTSYSAGETLTMVGLKINAHYSDGTTQLVNYGVSGLSYDPAEGTTLTTAITSVTITYTDGTTTKTCTQAIVVAPPYPVSATIATPPTKTHYASGETLTMAGLALDVVMNDGTHETISYGTTGLSYSPAEGTTISADQNVTITFTRSGHSVTCTQAVYGAYTGLRVTNAKSSNASFDFQLYGSAASYWTGKYSLDEGDNWTNITATTTITIPAGKSAIFEGTQTGDFSDSNYLKFALYDSLLQPSGNIMSLVCGSGFKTNKTIPHECAFYNLFSGTALRSTLPTLPATTLTAKCYYQMFAGCTGLTAMPTLPATTLAYGCYGYMFSGCAALTSVPTDYLPATRLASSCYEGMFKTCTALTAAPSLPATSFNECSFSYGYMFQGCTSLTTAPELLATNFTNSEYLFREMFRNCTNLNSVTVKFTSWPASAHLTNWLNGVAATGTFNAPAALPDPATRGASTVPEGWDIVRPVYAGLTFTANTAGSTVTLTNGSTTAPSWTGYYSTDSGGTWTTYTRGTAITLTNVGDKVCFKGTQNAAFAANAYLKFVMTGSIAASGNLMSLWCGDNFATATEIPYNYAGYKLFSGCTVLTTPPCLPATTLKLGCYSYLFYNCSSLTAVPALPATAMLGSMINACYACMFQGCTSLIVSDTSGTGYDKAWRIPTSGTFANTVAMTSMFKNCATGGGRASDSPSTTAGSYLTYYTQNTPV